MIKALHQEIRVTGDAELLLASRPYTDAGNEERYKAPEDFA